MLTVNIQLSHSARPVVPARSVVAKAPFIWRKVVPGKRVTLLAESTLPSVYMRKKLTPLPEPRANFPIKTGLAHALIVSP